MPTERRMSAIAGEGTFTLEDVAAGTALIELGVDATTEADVGVLNHSCDPTLGFSDGRTLVARRDVEAGQELTIDYAMFLDDPSYVFPCHCETYRCRQLIEGIDWQIPQLQTRYAGNWAPRIRKLIEAG